MEKFDKDFLPLLPNKITLFNKKGALGIRHAVKLAVLPRMTNIVYINTLQILFNMYIKYITKTNPFY